jgi:hypothetical protein
MKDPAAGMREPSPAASSKQPEENQKAPMASRGFLILLTSPPSREENPPKLCFPRRASGFGSIGMYRPPPLRTRSVPDDKKVLLIDPHQLTRNACASDLRRLLDPRTQWGGLWIRRSGEGKQT